MPSEPAGTIIWDSPLHTLPAAQFASVGTGADGDDSQTAAADDGADANAPNAPAPPINGVVIVNGQRIALRGNGRIFVGRGGQLRIVGGGIIPPGFVQPGIVRGGIGGIGIGINQPNVQVNPNGDNVVEEIEHLVPAGDRVVFSTTGGGGTGSRVVCLNLADGHVQWQTSLEDHQIDQLAANDDFVVIRASNDNDTRLVAFDALTGQPVWRPHPFGHENNDVESPINLCLAEDGSLVYLTADHVCCKDLFDPKPDLRFNWPVASNRNNMIGVPNAGIPTNTFLGATAPDQLIVSDGKVLAVSDNGSFVRVYKLADGKPFRRSADAENLLNTEVVDSPWNVHMRVVGTKLYVFGPNKILNYDLDDADDPGWNEPVDTSNGATRTTVRIRDVLLTKQNVLLLLEPGSPQRRDPADTSSRMLLIRPISRETLPNGHESGLITHLDRLINVPSGISQLQVVDGGIYYAAGDHQMHFMRGGPATQ
jgi:outer membrane protein assembly factor BamB